jgi:hypothetical protein
VSLCALARERGRDRNPDDENSEGDREPPATGSYRETTEERSLPATAFAFPFAGGRGAILCNVRFGGVRNRLRWCRDRRRNVRDRISDVRHRCGLRGAQAVVAERGETVSRVCVTALMRADEGILGFGQFVVLDQEPGDLERAAGVTSMVGTDVCGRGTVDVAPLLEQYAELGGGARVTALVRAH